MLAGGGRGRSGLLQGLSAGAVSGLSYRCADNAYPTPTRYTNLYLWVNCATQSFFRMNCATQKFGQNTLSSGDSMSWGYEGDAQKFLYGYVVERRRVFQIHCVMQLYFFYRYAEYAKQEKRIQGYTRAEGLLLAEWKVWWRASLYCRRAVAGLAVGGGGAVTGVGGGCSGGYS